MEYLSPRDCADRVRGRLRGRLLQRRRTLGLFFAYAPRSADARGRFGAATSAVLKKSEKLSDLCGGRSMIAPPNPSQQAPHDLEKSRIWFRDPRDPPWI
jgi:hypothetical protein